LRSIENDVTLAHASRPSGAIVGEPMRRTAPSASTSKGFLLRGVLDGIVDPVGVE
jgi:hypothetical protein